MQNLYENFAHETFYVSSNYSNRAVIYVNHTKIFLHENFYHKFICKKIKRITVNLSNMNALSEQEIAGQEVWNCIGQNIFQLYMLEFVERLRYSNKVVIRIYYSHAIL